MERMEFLETYTFLYLDHMYQLELALMLRYKRVVGLETHSLYYTKELNLIVKGLVNAKLAKNVVLKSVSRSIYIRERYDFTIITIFGSIGVDSDPKLVAIIFISGGMTLKNFSLKNLKSICSLSF
jgi:hypothetical protein